MKKTFSFVKEGGWLTMTLAVAVSVFLIFAIAQAATTISTSITTEGDLQVDGNSTIGSAVGDSVTANAYFTQLRIGTGSTFGHIGTVGADELGVEGDIEIDGTAYFDGLASTSALKVGDEPAASTINGLAFGYCTIPATSVLASTTSYANCTGATGVVENDRVFIQATSSLLNNFMVTAASSTATAGTITVRIFNNGSIAGTDTGAISFNFWAAR